MKVILPGIWIPVFGIGALSGFLRPVQGPEDSPKWVFLFMWIAGSVFICWGSVRYKEVSVDEEYLYVSNYIKEITIPLSEIVDVTENRWLNTHPVTIHLKSPSEFGDEIVFMPTIRFFGLFGSHPVVSELKRLARSKRY
jgi:hypothetical protein